MKAMQPLEKIKQFICFWTSIIYIPIKTLTQIFACLVVVWYVKHHPRHSFISAAAANGERMRPSDGGAKEQRRMDSWPLLLGKKGSQFMAKLFVSALLMGISFRLFFTHSNPFFPLPTELPNAIGLKDARVSGPPATNNSAPPATNNSAPLNATISEMALVDEKYSQQAKCDLFNGEWIPNPSGPAYTNMTCQFIESPQNCMKNGRPDTGYLYWRWKPHGCAVPPFDADKFMDAMRNKSWALIGDSILRNHVQSLICLLSKVEKPVEVYHDETYKSRRWRFYSHNFTLSLIWTPFLVEADISEDENGNSKSEIELHLDTLDRKWTSEYHSFDYIVISGGQWFLKTAIYLENRTVTGCHYCNGKRNITELSLEYSYGRALHHLFHFITTSDHKPIVIYRTWTPYHFENGEWFSGGTCNRTVPYREGEFNGRDVDMLMRSIELEEFHKAARNETRLKLLDTYHLSLLRPDGHSGPYRNFNPFGEDANAVVQNDCLHWCLPGPIDSWNDLILELVLN